MATLTAMANPGYVFINWTQYGMVVSTEPSFSITVTEGGTSNFEATSFDITQTTNFANGWSWWSGYIELDDSSLETLQNILGTSGMMIKSQNDGYVSYVSGYGWYGSLSSINNVSTYRVRANEACTVERGLAVNLVFDDAETGMVHIEMVNAHGVVVETVHVSSVYAITAPDLAGLYMLRVTVGGKGTCHRKWIVK